MIRVEVTFVNKEGQQETAKGKLVCWFLEGDGYLIAYAILDDGRIVTNMSEGQVMFKEITETEINEYKWYNIKNHEYAIKVLIEESLNGN